MIRSIKPIRLLAVVGVGAMVLVSGCADLIANLIEERSGNISVTFINNTRYRAAFTFGTYDSLDRGIQPGAADVDQLLIEAMTTEDGISLTCARNFAISTEELFERITDLELDDVSGFDDNAFDTVVHFSSAPVGSAAEALPTAGTAEGLEVLLGVDYACEDELIFTLVGNPTDGFSIQFTSLRPREGS